jgi:hypothetical protein
LNPELKGSAGTLSLIVVVTILGVAYVVRPQVAETTTTHSTTFAFDPAPGAVSYKVLWGGSTNTYTNCVNIGSNIIFTLRHNEPDCHAIACSVDEYGNESAWSNPAGVYRRGVIDTVYAQTNADLALPFKDAFKVAEVTNSTGSMFYRLRIQRVNNNSVYP